MFLTGFAIEAVNLRNDPEDLSNVLCDVGVDFGFAFDLNREDMTGHDRY